MNADHNMNFTVDTYVNKTKTGEYIEPWVGHYDHLVMFVTIESIGATEKSLDSTNYSLVC